MAEGDAMIIPDVERGPCMVCDSQSILNHWFLPLCEKHIQTEMGVEMGQENQMRKWSVGSLLFGMFLLLVVGMMYVYESKYLENRPLPTAQHNEEGW
jgi:hypothetical protein